MTEIRQTAHRPRPSCSDLLCSSTLLTLVSISTTRPQQCARLRSILAIGPQPFVGRAHLALLLYSSLAWQLASSAWALLPLSLGDLEQLGLGEQLGLVGQLSLLAPQPLIGCLRSKLRKV